MNATEVLSEHQAASEIERIAEETPLTEPEFDHLENELRLRANCRGWTGDPLQQPATTVLACIHAVLQSRTVQA